MAGNDIWRTAVAPLQGGAKPEFVPRYCFFSLGIMLHEAESAAFEGNSSISIEKLRELQAHCEKMIDVLAPNHRGRPKLVALGDYAAFRRKSTKRILV
jgi:hypothetical protein